MPALLALFFRLLGVAIVPLGWRLLSGLGFGIATFTGVQLGMDQIKDYFFTQLLSVPTQWLQLIGLLKVDVCANILFSAFVARAVLWGMNKASGSKSSIKFTGTGS